MKELILNKEGLMLRQSSASTRELTTQAREGYSRNGEIFMEGNPDMSPTDSQPTELGHISEASPKGVSKILGQEPNKLLEQPIPADKLKTTSTEELRRAYLDLLKVSSSLEKGQTFGGKGETAAKFMPVNAQIINELQLRGVDVKELFLQAAEDAVKRGSRIGSIGAADVPGAGEPPAPPVGGTEKQSQDLKDYKDPILADIVAVLNGAGTRKRLDPRFVNSYLQRVGTLMDAGKVNSEEGIRLQIELEAWMSEADKVQEALQAQAEENRGKYFKLKDIDAILKDTDGERERVFEEIFIGADANPGVQFDQALGLVGGSRLVDFFDILSHARIFDNGKDITDLRGYEAQVAEERQKLNQEFSGRSEVRRVLHNANWSVSESGDIEAFQKTMESFKSGYIDLIFSDPLTGTAMHMFEQAFQQIKAENGGQLPDKEIAWDYKKGESNLESRVWKLIRETMHRRGTVNVPEWQLRRSVILARGFGAISLRFPEIAAEARLPKDTPGAMASEKAGKMASIYAEAIARYLDPLEHIVNKFNLGEEDRAFLYFFLTGEKRHFENKKQLAEAIAQKSQFEDRDKRLIDIINLFRTGGPFSNSDWRAFAVMEGWTKKMVRSSGLGIREARLGSEVEDEITTQLLKTDPNWSKKTATERKAEIKKALGSKEKQEDRKNKERLEIWKDALKANPLRVMWMLEAKTQEAKKPSKRLEFLRAALGNISEDKAKALLPQVEQDLMIIQENTVLNLQLPKGDQKQITYDDPDDMLKYNIIGGDNPTPEDKERRERVRKYVEKIRQEVKAGGDYTIIRSFFEKTPVQKSPFPFIIGMEDIPFSDFNFINAGARGFARRINDFAYGAQASNALVELIVKIPTTHDIGPLIESLVKIKSAVMNYDKNIAMDILPYIEEGIIRMYDKKLVGRLPLGIGTMASLLQDTSYAQELFGREAMTWSEGDKFNFTRHLMRDELGKKEDIAKLRERVGATYLNLGIDLTRTYGQLILLLLAYEFAKRVGSEK